MTIPDDNDQQDTNNNNENPNSPLQTLLIKHLQDPSTIIPVLAITSILAVLLQILIQSRKPDAKTVSDASLREMQSLVDDGNWGDDEVDESERDKLRREAKLAGEKGLNDNQLEEDEEEEEDDEDEEEEEDDEEEEEGPFKKGERVILQNLAKAAHLNDQHGVIASKLDKTTSRYAVDLDLLPPSSTDDNKTNRVLVKPVNIKPEPPLPSDLERAPVHNGCLIEEHGRSVSFIFEAMRYLIGCAFVNDAAVKTFPSDVDAVRKSGPEGIAKLNEWTSMAWQYWDDLAIRKKKKKNNGSDDDIPEVQRRHFANTKGAGVHTCLKRFIHEQLSIGFHNDLVKNATHEQRACGSWSDKQHYRLRGTFWIVSSDANGTYLIPDANKHAVYHIAACGPRPLAPSLLKQFGDRPTKFRLNIVPWYGRLIHDGLLEPALTDVDSREGNMATPPVASLKLSRQLKKALTKAKSEGRVVDRLRCLELLTGVTKVPPRAPTERPSSSSSSSSQSASAPSYASSGSIPQDPPTDQELQLVKRISSIPPIPGRNPTRLPPGAPPLTSDEKKGHWLFRRKGHNKSTNPTGEGLVITPGGGPPVGDFKIVGDKPTSVEILLNVARLSVLNGKMRPILIGIDDWECSQRVGFLFREVGDVNVVFFKPSAVPAGR